MNSLLIKLAVGAFFTAIAGWWWLTCWRQERSWRWVIVYIAVTAMAAFLLTRFSVTGWPDLNSN